MFTNKNKKRFFIVRLSFCGIAITASIFKGQCQSHFAMWSGDHMLSPSSNVATWLLWFVTFVGYGEQVAVGCRLTQMMWAGGCGFSP